MVFNQLMTGLFGAEVEELPKKRGLLSNGDHLELIDPGDLRGAVVHRLGWIISRVGASYPVSVFCLNVDIYHHEPELHIPLGHNEDPDIVPGRFDMLTFFDNDERTPVFIIERLSEEGLTSWGSMSKRDNKAVKSLLHKVYSEDSFWRRSTPLLPLGVFSFFRQDNRLRLIVSDSILELSHDHLAFEKITENCGLKGVSQEKFLSLYPLATRSR